MNNQQDTTMLSSPIFIVGYMHSGTTLAQQVISRNNQMFTSGGETRHYSHLDVVEKKFPDLDDEKTLTEYVIYLLQVICTGYNRVHYGDPKQDPLEVIKSCGITEEDINNILIEARNKREYAALLGVVYNYLTLKDGKKRWLDKAPSYIMYLNYILAMHPNARIIDLVRDPRDVLASKWSRSKGQGNYVGSYEGSYDPVWDTLAWRAAVRAGDSARARYPDNILRVRYEDLVTDPKPEVIRICKFLDLEYTDKMLSVEWINTSADLQDGAGIGTNAIGKWKKKLPLADVFICQQLAKGEMQENKYEFATIPSADRLKAPIILGRSGGDFFVRLYKKLSVGGKRWTPVAEQKNK